MLKQLKLFTTLALVAGNVNFQATTIPSEAPGTPASSFFAPFLNPFIRATNEAFSKVVQSVANATTPTVVKSTEEYAKAKLISFVSRLGALYTRIGRPIMTQSVALLLWIITFIIAPRPATPGAQAAAPTTSPVADAPASPTAEVQTQ